MLSEYLADGAYGMYIHCVRYDWDAAKNETNVAEHGIAFADAVEIFSHPMLTCIDQREDYGEERWVGVGSMKGVIAVVVYTEDDDEEVTRIISARKATRNEETKFKTALGY
jgi:uncharacterized protein